MSRRLLDDYQVGMAMRNEAMPALERLAENDPLREHSLSFDRDDPPPYTSFAEDDDEEEDVPPVDETLDETIDETVNKTVDEIRRLIDEPLTDEEYKRVACGALDYELDPGQRYNLELEFELERVRSSVWDRTETTRKYFHEYNSVALNRAGEARTNIIARRNIKRRWQQLGVWNPAWGIPGREDNPLPKDNEEAWKWPWQQDDAVAAPARWSREPRPAVIRALELRRGMRQNDHSPVIPRSRLGKDVSASQAESFITSRPWFMFELERNELARRKERVWRAYDHGVQCRSVAMFWKERGDWKEEWPRNYRTHLIGWKWRHESPSPEPEDLTRLDDPTLELTPSEVDALEAVRPPAPPPPEVYWEPPPGHVSLFGSPLTREEVEARNRIPPPPPVRWARLCQPQQPPVEDEASPPQTSQHQDQEELGEPAPRSTRKRRRQEDEAEQQSPPPRRRQTRPRQYREEPAEQAPAPPPPPRQKRQRRVPAEGQPPSDPPVRRSARIAAAATSEAAPAPASRRPSRVSEPKPPAQVQSRPRKKARR